MYGLVVRFRSLDVGEGADRTAETFLEPKLRQSDLARRLVDFEIGERPVRDAVRLDANPLALEIGKLVPLDRPVEDPLRGEVLFVRQRMAVVEVADGDEQDGGVRVL